MKLLFRLLPSLLASVLLSILLTGMASAHTAMPSSPLTQQSATQFQSDSLHGCPSGAVCLYPQNAGWNGDRPSFAFYSYGAHNLSYQFGQHYVLNNQTGGATARTCTEYNGAGDCQGYLGAGYYVDKDLTPINSILLVQP